MQKVEIGPVILEKKIFKFRQCIFTISYHQGRIQAGALPARAPP